MAADSDDQDQNCEGGFDVEELGRKGRGGRPRLPDGDRLDSVIRVRLRGRDLEALYRAWAEAGPGRAPFSAYLRDRLTRR